MNPDAFENTLEEHYSVPDFLSAAHRVVYQEGCRGNHLLFSSPANNTSTGRDLVKVEAVAEALLSAATVDDMRNLVGHLNTGEQAALFRLYMDWLVDVTHRYRVSLN